MTTRTQSSGMLRSARHVLGYTCAATDGEIGKVKDMLLDDLSWSVRYFVVNTGNWLVGRQVLLSPASFGTPDWMAQTLPIRLTRKQIEESPPLEYDRPVSRQLEHSVAAYYGWPIYWGGPATATMAIPVMQEEALRREAGTVGEEGDPHLRSLKEISGYHLQARDGEIGHLEDLIVDDADWRTRYLVVDTRNWIPGRKVLVAPHWFTGIDWAARVIAVDLDKERIKNSPPYEPDAPVNRGYEERLYDFYGRPAYWL